MWASSCFGTDYEQAAVEEDHLEYSISWLQALNSDQLHQMMQMGCAKHDRCEEHCFCPAEALQQQPNWSQAGSAARASQACVNTSCVITARPGHKVSTTKFWLMADLIFWLWPECGDHKGLASMVACICQIWKHARGENAPPEGTEVPCNRQNRTSRRNRGAMQEARTHLQKEQGCHASTEAELLCKWGHNQIAQCLQVVMAATAGSIAPGQTGLEDWSSKQACCEGSRLHNSSEHPTPAQTKHGQYLMLVSSALQQRLLQNMTANGCAKLCIGRLLLRDLGDSLS